MLKVKRWVSNDDDDNGYGRITMNVEIMEKKRINRQQLEYKRAK